MNLQTCALRVIGPALVLLFLFLSVTYVSQAAEPGDKQARQRSGAAAHTLRMLGAGITRRKGATVGVDLRGEVSTEAALPWLRELPLIEALDLSGTDFADDDLAALAGMTKLTSLNLAETRVTGRGLAALSELPQLEHLSLAGIPLQDAEIQVVVKLKNLRTLDLSGSRLSNPGLIHLKDLSRLRTLSLRGTDVTDDGADVLIWLPELQDLDWRDTRLTGMKVHRYLVFERWLIADGMYDTNWPFMQAPGRLGNPKVGEDKIVLSDRVPVAGHDKRMNPHCLTIYTRAAAVIFENFYSPIVHVNLWEQPVVNSAINDGRQMAPPTNYPWQNAPFVNPPANNGRQLATPPNRNYSWQPAGYSAVQEIGLAAQGKGTAELFFWIWAADPNLSHPFPWFRLQAQGQRHQIKFLNSGRTLTVNDRFAFELGNSRIHVAVSADGTAREL